MKLAIVVGHNSARQGALRTDTGESEYVWNNRLALLMSDLAPEFGITTKIFRRVDLGSYTRELAAVYSDVDRWGADASIELHFNSFVEAAASGTETLSSGTAASLRFATAVQEEVVAALGLSDRGVKTRREGRGAASLISGRAPAILVEPFYGTSAKGQRSTDEAHEQEALARAYLRGAGAAFATFPRADLAASRTLQATATQRRAQAVQTQAAVGSAVVVTAATEAREQIEAMPAIGALADWLPWMKMGDRVGLMFTSTVGGRLTSIEQLPEPLLSELKNNYPEYMTPPPLDDSRPNRTSWMAVKDHVDAQRSGEGQ